MFGNKRLEMPKDVDSCRIIMHNFGLVWPDSTTDLMHNAKRLVELNNEVYDRLFEKWREGYNDRIIEEQEQMEGKEV